MSAGNRGNRSDAPYIEETDGCWLWQRATNDQGYGVLRLKTQGRNQHAHRFYFEQTFGAVPPGMGPSPPLRDTRLRQSLPP
jgi:hypothetical protein